MISGMMDVKFFPKMYRRGARVSPKNEMATPAKISHLTGLLLISIVRNFRPADPGSLSYITESLWQQGRGYQ